ncbi:hypothetical protein HX001_15020 [Empedobacter brevis]|uniref:Uncharacterized protein n=2 Tax=Empedobacter brevis TaxID=247 RepID=A0A511NCB7_9FLAO|nr:hypothetical protein [Empedobacter brevis]MDM1073799.1 hypothetical protein [Empedobacter brevis]QES93270.1 hypothetical protein F0358_11395 [Empedobacter brevis]QHC85097.1 hypothetical protein AS589_10060 [Empedobacter brevis]GEM50247.1 hypothetical protein EB1_00370 [Empedobacter brevis NBRC 14943 = ATCC 43319]
MTAQIGEILLIDHQQYIIAEQPLHNYFKKLDHPPYFTPPSPTCWRGYYGKWELRDDELFLINFKGYLDDLNEVDLAYLFPGQEDVFAKWYSGIVKIPQGKLINFNQLTHTSIYEEDLMLCFENGKLIDYIVHSNCTNSEREVEI